MYTLFLHPSYQHNVAIIKLCVSVNTFNYDIISEDLYTLMSVWIIFSTGRVPIEGTIISVCDVFEIQDNNINYYHYQPEWNIIVVYFKHITHTL